MPRGVGGDLGFVGRGEERAAIAARAADAAAGRPWVVWIEGVAGAGKTALLRSALAALPPGFAVLRAEASEMAADIPFDLVSQLGEVTETAPFPVGMELLGLWGKAGRVGPVAVVVEDLHWADPESRLALLAAARRLREDRVLIVVTSRPGEGDGDGWERLRADPDRCLHARVGPLSAGEVSELAAGYGVAIGTAAAARLVRHTGGHALYVRTLLVEIPPDALAGGEGELPAPRSLASTTLARIAELPADARRLTAALAVLNQATSLAELAVVAGVTGAALAADGMLGTGFVIRRDSGGRPSVLEFAHPLYRAAVYADMAPSLRQVLHLAAAGVTSGAAALGHRVAAADSADANLAAELDRAAQDEAAGRYSGRAASHLLWAAQLSSTPADAERRLLAAARLLLAARRVSQVEPLRARIEACAAQPLRSLVLGLLAYEQAEMVTAERWLREAAAETAAAETAGAAQPEPVPALDDGITAEALARLGVIFAGQQRAAEAAEVAARALASPTLPPVSEMWAYLALAFADGTLRGAPAALERMARRLPQPAADVPAADVDHLITRGSLQNYAGHPHAAAADLRAAVRLTRHGASQFPHRTHAQLSQALFRTGDWDEALVHGRVALSLISDGLGEWHGGQAHASLACVLGSRGDWAGASEHLAAAQRTTVSSQMPEAHGFTLFARALIGTARGEPEGLIEELTPLAERREVVARIGAQAWWPLLVMAQLSTGALDDAARHIAALTALSAEQDLDARIMGLRARLHARSGQPDAAAAAFARAADLFGPDDPFLELALLHQDYGAFLLARGNRRDGVARLMRARDMLAGTGAVPYLLRLDAELAAAGVRSSAPAGSPVMALTDREADVVALVSKGMTNAEVAAELYVSVNTVEYHLRNAFLKLGVRSRRELRGRAAIGG